MASGSAPCGPQRPRNCGKARSRHSQSARPRRCVEAGKSSDGFCPSVTILLAAGLAVADPRPIGKGALQPAQAREGSPGRSGILQEIGERIAHSGLREPARAGQRMISPRSTVVTTVCVKWFRAAYSAKKCSSTAPSRKTPPALERLFLERDGHLDAARGADAEAVLRPGARRAGCRALLRPRIRRSIAVSPRSAKSARISRKASPSARG